MCIVCVCVCVVDDVQEKPRVDVKRFVKIGRPGYKGEQVSCHVQ